MKSNGLLKALTLIAGSVFACAESPATEHRKPNSIQPLTVAFIGDQGSDRGAVAVLRLIKAEGADLVLHQGDLDYDDDPDRWDRMVTTVLGDDFPYFAAIGNHDIRRWSGRNGYRAKLLARLKKNSSASCHGDVGIAFACSYRGLFFVQSAIGTMPNEPDHSGHLAFIQKSLAETNAVWRICSWHKNQNAMQVGRKRNDVGWKAYEACRNGGAIVATGHEHSYSRTHLMDNFETQQVASTASTLEIGHGKSFAFVSGLGGRSIRDQDQSGAWWAAVYTSDQQANFGALFCTFFVDGVPNRARCYFKDIAGNVPDRFELVSNNS